MKRFNSKNNIKYHVSYLFIIMGIMILFMINYFGNNITPKLIDITKYNINVYNNKIIMDNVNQEEFSKKMDEIVILVKNGNDDIVAVNYNMNYAYDMLKNIYEQIKSGINNESYGTFSNYKYDIKDGLVVYYPLGLASNNIFFNNLGPKIPVLVLLANSVLSGIRTKVSNYGINNSLVEMYIKVNISSKIITPVVSEVVSNEYEILLGAKVVLGRVPSYLNGTIDNSSQMLTK